MAGLFGGSSTPAAPQVIRAPTPADPAIEDARRKQLILAGKAKGRASTILTGGRGVLTETQTARKQLLGQ